jgi:hypothetical protein
MGYLYCFGCVLDIRGGEKSREGAQPVRQSQANLRSTIVENLATSDPRALRIARIPRRRFHSGMNHRPMSYGGQAAIPSLPVGARWIIPIIGNATLPDNMAMAIYEKKFTKFFVLILQVDGVVPVGISLCSPCRSRHLGKERILSVGFHRDGNGTFFRDPSRR